VAASILVPLAVLGGGDTPEPVGSVGSPFVVGAINAPGGAFLRDQSGRVVLLHGVNAVYKRAPFELFPAPGQPYNFSVADAAEIAGLGFNVVRLGMTWQGLEPGSAGPNDPAICSPGAPRDPGQFDATVLEAYLSRLKQTVDLLGRFHLYSLLDMHQDVYSQVFGGDGAPPWAVCTNGLSPAPLPGRWSNTYASPALNVAFSHFWKNDVVGNLQGEYDRVCGAVASYFRTDPWVIGYDPINEPFSTVIQEVQQRELDAEVECLYTGAARPGRNEDQDVTVTCPPADPATGLIPTVLQADPNHLIFYEPDIYSSGDGPNYVGPMAFPNLVLNFHTYCPSRSTVTGDPTNLASCVASSVMTMGRRAQERVRLGSDQQPGGPPWFLGEFGATSSSALLQQLTVASNQNLLGWAYWQWKYYMDPTGRPHEALASASGRVNPTARALSQTYAQAIAGTPTAMSFDATTGAFTLAYTAQAAVKAPTLIFVPVRLRYPTGYCAHASGGTIVSKPGSNYLQIRNDEAATNVVVQLRTGSC
jgi:endoglycosylceramidase